MEAAFGLGLQLIVLRWIFPSLQLFIIPFFALYEELLVQVSGFPVLACPLECLVPMT